MPLPYRRACSNCVKSKRRCDLGSPSCHRCKVKALDCVYEAGGKTSHPPPRDKFNLGLSEIPSEISLAATNQGSTDFPVDQQLVTAFDNNASTDVAPEDAGQNELLPPFPDHDLDWSAVMANIDDYVVPDNVGELHGTEMAPALASEIYQARTVYTVKRLKLWPSKFVSDGQNDFINPNVYSNGLPQILQTAMSVCALHQLRTSKNESVVRSVVSARVAELLTVQRQGNSHLSVLEQLARLQAMVLYQTIRYFDGDLRLRRAAEGDEAEMRTWAKTLQSTLSDQMLLSSAPASTDDDPFPGVTLPAAVSKNRWRRWLLDESLRRTLGTHYLVQGVYTFIAQGWDTAHYDMFSLSFCGNGAAWWAPAEHHWETALAQRGTCTVRYSSFERDWDAVRPGDEDEMGVVVMALGQGIDWMCKWLGVERLKKWGLDWEY